MGKEHLITIDGEAHTKTEWCKIKGISWGGLKYRMSQGMTLEEALTKPVQERTVIAPQKIGKKDPANLAKGKVDNKKCRKCRYSDKVDGDWACCYILKELKRRPCPPGEKCTVDKPKSRKLEEQERMENHSRLFGRKI